MEIAFFLVVLVATVLAGTAVADRTPVPAPLVLVALGAAATFVPAVPEVHLEPEVVLLGLLPPLLYAAALQTSLVDFSANRRPILLLSVGLVVFTTVGVGVVVHLLLPGVSWPAAFAIGAVVAPPDAVAATAIGRRIGLPRRVVTVLEGESLLNDATALVSLRTAVAAGSVGVAAFGVARDFVWAAGGGTLLGVGCFAVVAGVRRRVHDPLMDTAVSLLTPFAAYLVAEELHSSGVLAVVVTGLLLGHKAPMLQTAQARLAERTNWRTVAFLLENTVFLLIGLQARWILDDVAASPLSAGRIAVVCVAALAAVIALRLLWVFPARLLLLVRAPWQQTLLLGWAGMRGVVTLAAAFVIPRDVEHREVLLLVAFTVVAGTLFVQGLSLPWLARRLGVPGPDPAEDALARATLLEQAGAAGIAELERLEYDDPHGVEQVVRQRVELRNFAAWERLSTTADEESPSDLYARVRRAMIDAERERVLQVRSSGEVPSEVVAEVLAALDVEEAVLEASGADERSGRGATSGAGRLCDHLRDAVPPADPEPAESCPACVQEGTRWVALRRCLACGYVGCCDSSPSRHATGHYRDAQHPVMQSAEPGEHWRWCYVDNLTG